MIRVYVFTQSVKGVEERALNNAGYSSIGYDAKREEKYRRQYLNLAQPDLRGFFRNSIPLDKPNMSQAYINAWVALAVSDVMTFGFDDYEVRFSMASNYFTDKGWQRFTQFIKSSRLIEMIEEKQQYVTAVPKSTPSLESEMVFDGSYQWAVQIPLILSYKTEFDTSNSGLLVTVVVKRSGDENHPYGIAIERWDALPR